VRWPPLHFQRVQRSLSGQPALLPFALRLGASYFSYMTLAGWC